MDLLSYCTKNNLNVLFVRAPHYVTSETYDRVKRSNQMASIVKEHGFSYYSIENIAAQIGIDEKRDFYNEDHMNIYGALKFTDYLAEKLVSQEKLKTDPLSNYLKDQWEDVVASTNQLYRYCDNIMTSGNSRGAQEDVITLTELENYSDAHIDKP